uniref:Uncharacterized protein n=1 Tax=Rhizophora mucronata TaxID=61149 RepID=A0A2P2QC84_RHIMU
MYPKMKILYLQVTTRSTVYNTSQMSLACNSNIAQLGKSRSLLQTEFRSF